MRIYSYHSGTRELIEAADLRADRDPMSPGKFLIPADATPIEPPPVVEGKTRHFDSVLSVWIYKDIPPAPEPVPLPTAAELRRAEILARLPAIDIESVRALRAKATGKSRAADDTKLAALDTEADTLRAELAAL